MNFSAAYAFPLTCLIGTAAAAHIPVRVVSSSAGGIVREAVVSTAAFNLGSADSRRLLDQQLRRAASLVCDDPRPASVGDAVEIAHCRREALASARRQVDVRALAAGAPRTATASLAPSHGSIAQ